jgi:hypothetical protein
MTSLPSAARERLANLIQPSQAYRWPDRESHTVPIGRRAWERYRNTLALAMERFADSVPVPEGDFNTVRAWAIALTEGRDRILSLLLAAEPFVPFDRHAAEDLLRAADEVLLDCANALRDGTVSNEPSAKLAEAITWWRSRESPHDDDQALAVAFGLPVSPVDVGGEFRADWVLQHYAYNNGALVVRVLGHLDALGVPAVPDVLVGLSIVGTLLNCDSPVSAYTAMDSFITAYLSAKPETVEHVLDQLRAIEPSLQRAKRMARQAFTTAVAADDAEARALALADMYKRTAEGPFRQHAWALFCLRNGLLEPTPMLTGLRGRLAAGGGLLAAVTKAVVLPGMRNSEAHETLEWDGIDEVFITESDRFPLYQVAVAASESKSFVAGCEAAEASVRALQVTHDDNQAVLPEANDIGRMPAWSRALAFFGTNNLRLTYEHLNTRNAQLRVTRLQASDINPCFQALLSAHRLLPRIQKFTVSAEGRPDTQITVSADALSATMPIWEQAIASLDRMPFATFLPANFDARRQIESERIAIRSAAWIAIDDILDAIDGVSEVWDEGIIQLLAAQIGIVQVALAQLTEFVNMPGSRLKSVGESTEDLRRCLADTHPVSWSAVQHIDALRRLRVQWEAWGPVSRHPLVAESLSDLQLDPRPELHDPSKRKVLRTV